jgi:hypothetical protein
MSESTRNKHEEDVSLEFLLDERERSYSFGEPRFAAISRAPAGLTANFAATVQPRLERIQTATDDMTEVRTLVADFENLPADKVVQSQGTLTTDPYVSIAEGKISSATKASVEQWAQQHPNVGQRDPVHFNTLQILMIDERTASVQYHIEEGGKVAASALIAIKGDDDKWRVAVHCQHPVG